VRARPWDQIDRARTLPQAEKPIDARRHQAQAEQYQQHPADLGRKEHAHQRQQTRANQDHQARHQWAGGHGPWPTRLVHGDEDGHDQGTWQDHKQVTRATAGRRGIEQGTGSHDQNAQGDKVRQHFPLETNTLARHHAIDAQHHRRQGVLQAGGDGDRPRRTVPCEVAHVPRPLA
jgi:hypothetical protein